MKNYFIFGCAYVAENLSSPLPLPSRMSSCPNCAPYLCWSPHFDFCTICFKSLLYKMPWASSCLCRFKLSVNNFTTLISIFLTPLLIEALNKQVKAVVVFNDVRSIHCENKIFKTWCFWCCFNWCDFVVRYITEILPSDAGGILNKRWEMSQLLGFF